MIIEHHIFTPGFATRENIASMITCEKNFNLTPKIQQILCLFMTKTDKNIKALEIIMQWRCNIDDVCAQLYYNLL